MPEAPAAEPQMALVDVKAELLHHGVTLLPAFSTRYGDPYLAKRRAYGNSDPLEFREGRLPQELYLLPDRLVCAVTIRLDSPWLLDWNEDEGFVVRHRSGGGCTPIDFPREPAFYDRTLSNGEEVKKVVTLYGGGSLGVFAFGSCRLVDIGKPCGYCSISQNRTRGVDFLDVISEARIEEALSLALEDSACPITQVMVNGGNFPDQDRSFSHYARLARAAARAVETSGRDVEVHLIVYPPNDLGRLAELGRTGVSVAMNYEVCDPDLFRKYCPGKTVYGGQGHIAAALRRAVEELGEGSVYSILVGGLEPLESLERGLFELAGEGVTPVVNVFHADPATPLEHHPVPSADTIRAMGRTLQEVYRQHEFARPFYLDCGRNSIDTEAWRGLF
jgi:hypothetical protein